jgi:hypothetical protein
MKRLCHFVWGTWAPRDFGAREVLRTNLHGYWKMIAYINVDTTSEIPGSVKIFLNWNKLNWKNSSFVFRKQRSNFWAWGTLWRLELLWGACYKRISENREHGTIRYWKKPKEVNMDPREHSSNNVLWKWLTH